MTQRHNLDHYRARQRDPVFLNRSPQPKSPRRDTDLPLLLAGGFCAGVILYLVTIIVMVS